MITNIPAPVIELISKLKSSGHQAFLVGGCARDSLLGLQPKEWDITTSALPQEVTKLFNKVIPTGIDYGTVTVILNEMMFEVTTFRSDEKYVDGRHPSNVAFTKDLHKDLSRRDFTINALAYDPITKVLIDDHNGQADLEQKTIRAIGDPKERFSEDGLRSIRACRFAAVLGFTIEDKTFKAIEQTLGTTKKVAKERIHDELVKIMAADKPSIAIELMRECKILDIIMPELLFCYGIEQPLNFHKYDVYWHSLYACDAAQKNNLVVRLAALLHDIEKPKCKKDLTFYDHDQQGARTAEIILKRLKFSSKDIKQVINLISQHMFNYTKEWTDSAVRRFIQRIGGVENLADLFSLRLADTIAMGKDNKPQYLAELQKRIDKIILEQNALHVSALKVDGQDIMKTLNIKPGPKVGEILNALLEKVLDDPSLNERDKLIELVKDFK